MSQSLKKAREFLGGPERRASLLVTLAAAAFAAAASLVLAAMVILGPGLKDASPSRTTTAGEAAMR